MTAKRGQVNRLIAPGRPAPRPSRDSARAQRRLRGMGARPAARGAQQARRGRAGGLLSAPGSRSLPPARRPPAPRPVRSLVHNPGSRRRPAPGGSHSPPRQPLFCPGPHSPQLRSSPHLPSYSAVQIGCPRTLCQSANPRPWPGPG